jgi:threonine dehydrogenase-like Zn-dependent dehydrogenase
VQVAVLDAPGRFHLEDRPIPDVTPGQVLVRVAACGVCTSELDVWEGRADGVTFPRTMGHEVSGVVECIGAGVTGFAPGDPVAVWAPGQGYAEYVAVDAAYCFAAYGLPLELALGEPLACAVNAVERADPRLADDIVIIGAGFMGNLVQKLVHLRGPNQVIVADTRPDALERAAHLGASRTVDVRSESLRDVVRALTDGRGADLTFEVTGTQGGLSATTDVTRMEGTIAIVGYHQGGMREIPLATWNWMAFRIANCHFRNVDTILHGMRTGMSLLRGGTLSLGDVVSHRFPLAEIDNAFRTAYEKPEGFVKATIVFGDR